MRRSALWAGLILAAAACVAMAAPAYTWRLQRDVSPPPVPADNPMTAVKVELGRRLFYDADLSVNGTISCATCHEQRRAFTDSNKTRPGVHGDPGRRNIMTLGNVGYFRSLTWGDPTHRSLEAQVLVPMMGEHPVEMGMAGQSGALAQRLGSDACYRRMFAAAFPEDQGEISMGAVAKALGAFQRTLISLDSPYDRVQSGHGPPLSAPARQGDVIFHARCASCHSEPMFTDAAASGGDVESSFHRIDARAPEAADDLGLGEITGKAADAGRFRTPPLRNVALTGPYLHDGSAATLAEAIKRHTALGQPPSNHEIGELVAFLETLTDARFVSDPRFALPKPGCPVRGR